MRRDDFSQLGGVYLNHASAGPLPDIALAAMRDALDLQAQAPSKLYKQVAHDIEVARTSAARLLHCNEANIAFVPSVSSAIHLAADALDWNENDEILLVENEFYAAVHAWRSASQRHGFTVRMVPSLGDTAAALQEAITSRTRLVSVSMVHSSTGEVVNIPSIVEYSQRAGINTFVDASQAIAVIPSSFYEGTPTFLAVNCAKSGLSPLGSALLVVDTNHRAATRLGRMGWRSVEQPFTNVDQPFITDASSLEAGTPNAVTVAGLAASLQYLTKFDSDKIPDHVATLAALLLKKCSSTSAKCTQTYGPIVWLRPLSGETSTLVTALQAEHITTTERNGDIRIALHCYTGLADVDRFGAVWTKAVKGSP